MSLCAGLCAEFLRWSAKHVRPGGGGPLHECWCRFEACVMSVAVLLLLCTKHVALSWCWCAGHACFMLSLLAPWHHYS